METNEKLESTSTDLESGAIMIENSSDDNSLHRSTLHTKTNHSVDQISDDDDTTRSGLWNYGDDNSTSNETGISPTMTHPGSHRSSNPISEESINIAKLENLAVMTWRLVMFGVLIVATIAVAVIIYYVSYNGEREDFERASAINSEKVFGSLGYSMNTKLEAVDSLATMLVSSARERNETWPFTVLPNSAAKMSKTRMLSDAIALQQYHYVEEDKRAEWEAFAKDNEAWVQETIEVERQDATLRIQVEIPDYDGNHSISIRYGGPVPNNTGPYTPTWHTYPC
jgi:hypothetical protein